MAQPGNFTPILLYGSSTPTNVPLAANLTNSATGSEIAINVADKNLFFKDSGGVVNTVPIRQSSTSSNGWLSATDWNTFNSKQAALVSGTNIKTVGGVTLLGSGDVGTIGTAYGGTGLTSFTSGGLVYASSTSALTTGSALRFDGASLVNTAGGFRSTVGGIDGLIGAGSFVTGVYGIGTITNNPVVIAPNLSESVRFHTSGGVSIGNTTDPGAACLSVSGNNLLVGTTNTSSVAGVGIKITGASTDPIITEVCAASTSAVTTYQLYSTGAAAFRFYVGAQGTVYATSTTISAISDQRYKENVQDLDVGLSKIMQLKPRKFDWKEGKGKNIKGDRGFIAQEFESVFPDLIDEWKDPAPEGELPYKSIRADLIPVLVKAIQELNNKFDAYVASHP